MESGVNTVTERNREMLYELTARFSLKDWAAVNMKNGKPKGRFSKPYSLGYDAEEAHEYYCLSLQNDLTLEQIGNIKAYLMLQRQLGNIE